MTNVSIAIRARILVNDITILANFKRLNPNYSFPMAKPDNTTNPGDGGWGAQNAPGWGSKPPLPVEAQYNLLTAPRCLAPRVDQSSYAHIPLQSENTAKRERPELTDEEFLIASPVVMGFSLTDKLWLEFNVEKVQPIRWNEDAFANLVLPADRKMLLQSLVEAHNAELSGFDDFIKGKGRGLVINLFGPPGQYW